ncbi:MAG: hypothetical protein AAF710_09380, partial [Planctomycetota bacterium]
MNAEGSIFSFRGRFTAGDLDGDGADDLVVCRFDEAEATDLPKRGGRRLSNFPPPDRIDPQVGRVFVARNISDNNDTPRLDTPEPFVADGRPVRTYMLAYPTVVDLDGDDRVEVLLSSDDNAIRVFRQNDSGWTELGPLSDPDGEPIQTSLARRVRP